MSQLTKKITINGNVNLMTALIAAGYKGTARIADLILINENATAVYVHLTSSAITAPGVGTDGISIGTGAADIQFALENIDGGLVWLYSAAAVDVKVVVNGDGI